MLSHLFDYETILDESMKQRYFTDNIWPQKRFRLDRFAYKSSDSLSNSLHNDVIVIW